MRAPRSQRGAALLTVLLLVAVNMLLPWKTRHCGINGVITIGSSEKNTTGPRINRGTVSTAMAIRKPSAMASGVTSSV